MERERQEILTVAAGVSLLAILSSEVLPMVRNWKPSISVEGSGWERKLLRIVSIL